MENTHFRVRRSLRSHIPAIALSLALIAPAGTAFADGSDEDEQSLINIIIDWIDDFFDPDEPDETLPSDGDGW